MKYFYLKHFAWFTLLFCLFAEAHTSKVLIPPAPTVAASSFYLSDHQSGRILAERNSDKKLPPASLTKIMTVYVVCRELQNGHLTLDEKATVSKKAWQTPGSRMFIEVNKQVSIEALLKGVIIQSGNDASVALAEHVAGDESTFASLMNQHAQRLGMSNTHFRNSTGLPMDDHYTTARDLAILTRAMINEFPEYYQWYAQREMTFNGIKQQNRNRLLRRDDSVDGVKTGHTEAAGYCLVASALRNDMRLISVVMGTASENARANESQSLLNYGFRFFETHKLYSAKEGLLETRVWKGDKKQLSVGISEDLYVTVPRRHFKDLKAETRVDAKIVAPVSAGQQVGTLNVSLAGDVMISKPLIAKSAIGKGGVLQRLYD